MSGDATRIVLNFKGKDRYNNFQDLTRVVPVVPGRQTFIEVKMKLRPTPVLVNTSEIIEITMGSSNSSDGQSNTPPVVLSLPPHSLMTESGEIYNGTANLEVSFADPRNESQVQEADGDFTAIGEDGDEQTLETFGVLKIDFTDSEGKPLQTNADIDVMLDLDEYNITEKEAEAIKLWYMDEKTGRWRIMDSGLKQHESRRSKRSGRKFYFGKIDNTRYQLLTNLDIIEGAMCYVKFTVENQNNGQESVKVTVVSKQNGRNRYREYTISGTSQCIRTVCRSLTIRANIGQNFLKPNDRNMGRSLKRNHGVTYYRTDDIVDRFSNRITIRDISNPIASNGPFFRSMDDCKNSPNTNSLIFDNTPRTGDSSIRDGQIKWHDRAEFSLCYLKITTKNSCLSRPTSIVTFHVESSNVAARPKAEEGFTIVSTSPSSPSTCAEFKCPPSMTRSIEVTVTSLTTLNGKFKMTQEFINEHMVWYAQVYEGNVAIFRPIPDLNKPAIGISFKNERRDVANNDESHNAEKEYCENNLIAGLTFDCA